jgi:hypothetical protein
MKFRGHLEDMLFNAPPFGQDLPINDIIDVEEELGAGALTDAAKAAAKTAAIMGITKQTDLTKPPPGMFYTKSGTLKPKSTSSSKASAVQQLLGKTASNVERAARSAIAKTTSNNKTRVVSGMMQASKPRASEVMQLRSSLPDEASLGLSQFVALNEAERRLADKIGARVRSDLKPQLDAITGMLGDNALQTQATNEHNIINNTKAFRSRVLHDLYRIAAQLPPNHPVRQKITTRLGLL